MRILVLYEELAWYIVNCLNVAAENCGAEILLVCKSPHPNAPFRFPFIHPRIEIVNREKITAAQLDDRIAAFKPQGIFLGGWSNAQYKRIVKRSGVPAAIGFDNQWTGSLKQRIGSIVFRLTLKRSLQKAFVPAGRQEKFARALGFTPAEIVRGIYCCDYSLFRQYYDRYRAAKEIAAPHRFLFVGRFVSEKGFSTLCEAFAEWKQETSSDWELWCVGKGDIAPLSHPAIRYFDFLQPSEMDEVIAGTSVFVLPSRFEPWGVVVHEFAAAGYPVLCTTKVGATELFLQDGKNGYVMEAATRQQLKEKLDKFSSLSQEEWIAMSGHSAKLASALTPEIWAARFMKLFEV